jgi:multiple sugar transport system ATP-binding protein
MSAIVCSNVSKAYGDVPVIRDFNLSIEEHEFVVFLGPSGCGKSTLLRMLAGLEDITGGTVSIDDVVVNELPPRDRGVAMVFQNYALYPHMTIFENIAFGLRRQKVPALEIKKRVDAVATVLGLDPFLERKPAALSGGQQQRVAIARAMIKTPKVFLFDEPLSNLDAKLRQHMRVEIARLHQTLKTTTVYVTHDQLEAMTLADRIVLMRAGNIEQVGTPQEIYENPHTLFIAGFIGTPNMNFLTGTIRVGGQGAVVVVGSEVLPLEGGRFAVTDKQEVVLGIRPSDVSIVQGERIGQGEFGATAGLVEYHGHDTLVSMNFQGQAIAALVPSQQRVMRGETIRFQLAGERLHLFDVASERSLRINGAKPETASQASVHKIYP